MIKKKRTHKEIAKEQYTKRINKIAERINKVMSDKKVVTLIKREKIYTVYFKNGQKFIFSQYFTHRFHENKIIPVHERESYVE